MSIKSEHSMEHLSEHHGPLLAAAALEGTDLEPCVPNATRLVGYGDTKHGYGPACLIDVVHTDYVMEPHVTWFPWTTAANKIVNFRWAMNHMAQTHQVLLHIEKKQMNFFEHFAKRGFLRKIGYIDNLPLVDEIHMYQVIGSKA